MTVVTCIEVTSALWSTHGSVGSNSNDSWFLVVERWLLTLLVIGHDSCCWGSCFTAGSTVWDAAFTIWLPFPCQEYEPYSWLMYYVTKGDHLKWCLKTILFSWRSWKRNPTRVNVSRNTVLLFLTLKIIIMYWLLDE